MNLDAFSDLEALEAQNNSKRDGLCKSALNSAKNRCEKWGIEIQKKKADASRIGTGCRAFCRRGDCARNEECFG
ncbi:hypothetical protein DPMN_139967 [Dreissena polymorpha]|uniref:Uncharacterized protein n=1 Tax=Dreissena polymorpha TaxID=45954 RepID=A0A9D4G796_DREPO|nr:hypothetical protein DPMN_139967 [Dreissena polymorpha]